MKEKGERFEIWTIWFHIVRVFVYESIDRAYRSTDPDSCGNKSGDLEGNRCHWRPTSWRKFLGQSIRSWSTGHSDQMEEKINVAHQHGMAFHLFTLPTNHPLSFDSKLREIIFKITSTLNFPFFFQIFYPHHSSMDHLITKIFKIPRVSI